MTHSKRFNKLAKSIDTSKTYSIEEAVKLAKDTSKTAFDGAIEAHFRLGIDVKRGDQQVRGTVALPHGTGKSKIIAAFVPEEKEKEAHEAGADIVGGKNLIQQIKQTSKVDFDIAVATPDMMPMLTQIAKILGPKGLMPSPKNETITTNLKKTIGELKRGKITFKIDDTANVHLVIGKASFEERQLLENFNAILFELKKSKPSSSKGVFIKNVSINSTMGPGIKAAV